MPPLKFVHPPSRSAMCGRCVSARVPDAAENRVSSPVEDRFGDQHEGHHQRGEA